MGDETIWKLDILALVPGGVGGVGISQQGFFPDEGKATFVRGGRGCRFCWWSGSQLPDFAEHRRTGRYYNFFLVLVLQSNAGWSGPEELTLRDAAVTFARGIDDCDDA